MSVSGDEYGPVQDQPPQSQHVADSVALDMEGYVRLGTHRRTFDDWLRAEGLIDQRIFYMRFGEGYVEAKCYLEPLRVSMEQEGAAWEWRRFPVSSLPPVDWRHSDGEAQW